MPISARIRSTLLLFVFLAFFSYPKSVYANAVILSAGAGIGQEEAADGHSYVSFTALSIRGGYAYSIYQFPLDTYLEYQRFGNLNSSSSSLLSVNQLHQELSVWGRYMISQTWRAKPYVAFGLGGSRDTIKTNFNGETSTVDQDPEFMLGAATGVSVTVYRMIEAQFELRLTSAGSYDPNPLLQAGAQLGFRF